MMRFWILTLQNKRWNTAAKERRFLPLAGPAPECGNVNVMDEFKTVIWSGVKCFKFGYNGPAAVAGAKGPAQVCRRLCRNVPGKKKRMIICR